MPFQLKIECRAKGRATIECDEPFVSLGVVDESSNNGEPSKRAFRRDSLVEDKRNRSNSNADELQSTMINFFPPRRSVII